jgi:hypothetical protein
MAVKAVGAGFLKAFKEGLPSFPDPNRTNIGTESRTVKFFFSQK